MTKAQIKAIIETDLGYTLGELMEMPKISIISSDMDGPIYPGTTTKLRFNMDAGNLEIHYGRKLRDGIQFNNNIPSFIIPFTNLYGITLVGPIHQPEPYKRRTGGVV